MFESLEVPKKYIPSDPRFGVGPSLIPVNFLENLAQTGISLLGTSHRQAPVRQLVASVQQGFKDYFHLPSDYQVVLGNGGATFLWDMIGTGIVEKKSIHFTCGEFSTKWLKAHEQIPWIETKDVNVAFGQGVDPKWEQGFDTLCCTLNETSTGVQISDFSKIANGEILVTCDATSGAGQIFAPMNKIDIFYFSPQKVFAGEGGLFFAFLSPRAMERALKMGADSSRYRPVIMDWKQAIENSEKNQTYNTPSVSNLFFVNQQLQLMNKIGYQQICQIAEEKAQHIYSWAESKPYLHCYVREDRYRSRSVATIDVDDKFSVDDLCKRFRKLDIAWDIESYRKLERNQFRISLFSNITLENLEKLTSAISFAIESEA